MYSHLQNYRVVLASNSPRRQTLLRELGVNFTVEPSKGDEHYPASLKSTDVAEFLALQKADWFTNFEHNELYLTADTVVVLGEEVLGKPKDKAEAKEILRKLSGNTHEVITGMCIKSKRKQKSFSVLTEVVFKVLTDEEINFYVNTYKPFDKAGAYGIQEWIGMIGITEIHGSYFNVVGLPTEKLFKQLQIFCENQN
tara:strand:- start:10981 stop:11571 length:591 start_codon:yes stop_codon:yes gene_type:complete